MTWQPVTPEWVTPSVFGVADLHVLAYRAFVDQELPWAGGVAAALAWVRGGRRGPVTEREEQPVTKALAQAEQWAAAVVFSTAEALAPPPLESVCSSLGVAYRPPVDVDPSWAGGSWRALRWLTGGQEEPPLAVPQRGADGTVLSADALFDREVVAAPELRYRLPEDRAALRLRVEREAARSRQLAALVTDTLRQLGVHRPRAAVSGPHRLTDPAPAGRPPGS